jgi:hypothetical protein
VHLLHLSEIVGEEGHDHMPFDGDPGIISKIDLNPTMALLGARSTAELMRMKGNESLGFAFPAYHLIVARVWALTTMR